MLAATAACVAIVNLMYQPAGHVTATKSVVAPVVLIAADTLGVPTVVYVVLSGETAITTEAAFAVPSKAHSMYAVTCRATGLTLPVPETHAPAFGSVPDVIVSADVSCAS